MAGIVGILKTAAAVAAISITAHMNSWVKPADGQSNNLHTSKTNRGVRYGSI
jgi:hypothetical protein